MVGCSASSRAPDAPSPNDVPVQVVSDRLAVLVQLGGGAPFPAILDTGSWGLRVLSGSVDPSTIAETTDTAVTYGYGSDLQITGVLAFATVTIGSQSTDSPIPIMLVQRAACSEVVPACNADQSLAGHFSSFPAILGVGMQSWPADHGIANPIAQLPGHPPFVVHVAPTDGVGVLRIGAEASDGVAFQTYPLEPLAAGAPLPDGTPVWNDFDIPGCMNVETTSTSYCMPTLLDTGSPATYVFSQAQLAPYYTELPLGSAVQVTVGPAGSPLGNYELLVGPDPTIGVDEVLIVPSGNALLDPGLALFYRFDVLFDQEHGRVGLAQQRQGNP